MNYDIEDMIRNKSRKNEPNLYLNVIAYEKRVDPEITKISRDYSTQHK